MPTRQEEIERLAALALAPLVEVAWADGSVTEAERQGVLEAAKAIGVEQHGEFARTTLRRWLHESPPTEALEAWRALLAPTPSIAVSALCESARVATSVVSSRRAWSEPLVIIEGGPAEARIQLILVLINQLVGCNPRHHRT